MLKEPTVEVYRSLAALEDDHNFTNVLNWLESCLLDVRLRNDKELQDVQLRQGQGTAQTLRDVLKYSAIAGERVNEIDHKQSRTP